MKSIALAAAILGAAATASFAGDMVESQIKLFQFMPKDLSVKAGTTVTWMNGDDIDHSVTAGEPGQESGAFDSGFFKKGGTYKFTFSAPGTYTYFCKRHPSMKASVVVTE